MSRRRQVQLLLWSYFWLLIFEGALRKWVVPGLSTPLLVVRDPIALWALIAGAPYLLRSRWAGWVWMLWMLGCVAVALAMLAGHRDIITALFGARVFWFHLPLIFLFGCVYSRDDAWAFVKALAALAIPMTVIAAAQYSLPQSHWVNAAPGGEEGVGFSAALGKFRPPGTFSFTNGLVEFYAVASAAVVALFLAGKRPFPKWSYVSLLALAVALPVSISRALLYKYVVNGGVALLSFLVSGRGLKAGAIFILALICIGVGAKRLSIVKDAQRTYESRWETANEVEGDDRGAIGALQHRAGGSTLQALLQAIDQPILGRGIGLGTNVGAMRVAGRKSYLVSETAWGNLFGELGILLGFFALAFRFVLAFQLGRLSFVQAKRGNTLPMLLSGAGVVSVLLGTTSQPTSLGFIVLSAGLMLAACNPTRAELLARANRMGSNVSRRHVGARPESVDPVPSFVAKGI